MNYLRPWTSEIIQDLRCCEAALCQDLVCDAAHIVLTLASVRTWCWLAFGTCVQDPEGLDVAGGLCTP